MNKDAKVAIIFRHVQKHTVLPAYIEKYVLRDLENALHEIEQKEKAAKVKGGQYEDKENNHAIQCGK